MHYVYWTADTSFLEPFLLAAKNLAPPWKTPHEPLLSNHISKILPDFTESSIDKCVKAALLVSHRGLMRCGKFTVKSHPKFDLKKNICSNGLTEVFVNGEFKAFKYGILQYKVFGVMGAKIPINPITGHPTCPIQPLCNHMCLNKIQPNEFLFSYWSEDIVKKTVKQKQCMLTSDTFLKRVNVLLSARSLIPITGHCIRIGRTTQLLRNGLNVDLVKKLGQGSSDSFLRYIRDIVLSLGENYLRLQIAHAPERRTFAPVSPFFLP